MRFARNILVDSLYPLSIFLSTGFVSVRLAYHSLVSGHGTEIRRNLYEFACMDYPADLRLQTNTRTISIVALFTSLVVATDYGLTPALNVKLMDTLVFSSAYAFGFRIGAYIAIFSELVWSMVNPYGFGGYIVPFLVGGELLYAFAGYFSSKVWGGPQDITSFSYRNIFFGAILAICAFVWDFETNIATGLLAGAHTLVSLLAWEIPGIPFMVPHELSDFMLGSLLAPLIIVYFYRVFGDRGHVLRQKNNQKIPQMSGKQEG